ncbi:MAG: hypothetical protein GYA51_04780 [Candidatus Methanofastidiosa archaeon]|nr:hypothetical protein [Candidatus Methanofastidiosa archaeon]
MGKIVKLGLTINAFDASELLDQLISEIRDQVDWVAAIYQKRSYWGNPMSKTDMDELNRLKSLGLIDELIEFKPNFNKYSREQECEKRNQGIELAKQRGCSHVLNIDADEFYDKDQFREAKNYINQTGWGITYWSYVNYYKDFEHYLVYPFRPLVPGIHSTFFKYTYNGPAPGPTDPTRRILNPSNLGTYVFPDEMIRMGHAAWIRRDIRKKLVNWSAKNHFPKELINKAVERWENWKEGETAIMLFNVPENNVDVRKLDVKIHKFEVPWLKEKKEV